MQIITFIQERTALSPISIENTLQLLREGATIPFIARYRKERTQGLDEVQIALIRDLAKQFEDIESRKIKISEAFAKLENDGKIIPDELKNKISASFDLVQIEDLFLPYKQKKESRGEKAKQLGLEPLAKILFAQKTASPQNSAQAFVKGQVESTEQALQGAADIIAEWVNEHVYVRSKLRRLFQHKAVLQTKVVKGKEEEGQKYKDYFQCQEPLNRCAAHRLLAILRAESEGFIRVKALPDQDEALSILDAQFIKEDNPSKDFIKQTLQESYKRLLQPSLENETLKFAKEKADTEAIRIFAANLRQLLLSSPLGNKRILAIDPGFRTGCKVVCLDESGELLHNQTIFPHPPQKESAAAKAKLGQLVEAYKIDAIAIGDGTAGRETEALVKSVHFRKDIEVYVVREDGASIYSASAVARKEFPMYDVTVRGAVSIGRRLMDPLAELVKIDPKSIGIGQYQHDVNQGLLKSSLDDVVISCVNAVGVNVNTASPYLLTYVSGLGETIASNIVMHRAAFGPFRSREELKKVKRLGDKAFEQAAGFLRILEGDQLLDNTAVHPESYPLVARMAKKSGCTLAELIGNKDKIQSLRREDYPEVDAFTFEDVKNELLKPGRDPRKKAKVLEFDKHVRTIQDLRVGMTLPGIVTNVAAFGAFVNLGIKENGLIHKSKLSENYVSDASQHIQLHAHVLVEVEEIDIDRKRIGLKLLKG